MIKWNRSLGGYARLIKKQEEFTMKKMLALLLALVLCASQVPVFAANSEMDCTSPDAPFSMVIRDTTANVLDRDLEKPVTVYLPNIYNNETDTEEWLSATVFGENATFTVTNHSVDAIKITYREYRKAVKPLYFGFSANGVGYFEDAAIGAPGEFVTLTGLYYATSYEWMKFVNKPGVAFELFSMFEDDGGDDYYYLVKKGETVTFRIPIQDMSFCKLYFDYYDGSGYNAIYKNSFGWDYHLMRDDARAGKTSGGTEPVQTEGTFTDVPSNAYYTEPVKWAVENGVTAGKTATSFAPNASCTRAQVVTFLWRAAGMPTPKGAANFTDVSAGAYYAQAVAWAAENGITGGKTATTFAPNATVSRSQVVTFLYRLAGNGAKGTNVFTDVPADTYYTDAVSWAVANGITEGKTQATFAPDASCTRAQIVTFLYRHFAK